MTLERRTNVSAIDVLDRVLDKGIVIDSFARIELLGIDLLTSIESHIVVASIDTYVKYAGPLRGAAHLATLMPPATPPRT